LSHVLSANKVMMMMMMMMPVCKLRLSGISYVA